MKKIIISIFVLALGFHALAQDNEVSQDELDKRNWFHKDFAETGIYGIGTDAALEFLQSKGLEPSTVVVGVLDSGVEITHEDLKDEIWVNPGETLDNKDSDENGYVDDINGWNFCTSDTGVSYDQDTYEATRVTAKYEPFFNTGDRETDLKHIQQDPEAYQTYLRARKDWAQNYYSAKGSGNDNQEAQKQELMDFFKELEAYAKDVELTTESIKDLPEETDEEKVWKSQVEYLINNNNEFQGKTIGEIIEEVEKQFEQVEKTGNNKVDYYYNLNYDPSGGKVLIGGYGNNDVDGPDSLHGTHVAGIIGATRGNDLGMDGVAGGVVKIMSVRAVPDGDERDEDIANAIRYAVDNGAKVLNMSFGKSFSPNKELVYDAIRYADERGVLMFHAAGNDNKDLDFSYNYPSNYKDNEMKPYTKNWITVGASTRNPENLKASFSNFGRMKVDIFAPGAEIYSTVPEQKYRYLQGTSMASPVAAGAAALIWSYFPELSSEQVKELLFETVNVSEVEVKVGSEREPRKFSELSYTGGVVDVNKAVRLAYERYGQK